MYDSSGIGLRLRQRVFVSLGLWHTYKQANLKIYQKYASTVMAPLFHFLFPGTKFYIKPRLVQVVTMFTYIRLSYRSWRKSLQSMMHDLLSVPEPSRTQVQNLHWLCEWFIPLVTSSTTILQTYVVSFMCRSLCIMHRTHYDMFTCVHALLRVSGLHDDIFFSMHIG
jgi:hypothetical protein